MKTIRVECENQTTWEQLAVEVIKLHRKRRIAAKMISDNLRRERKSWDKHYERSRELIKIKKVLEEKRSALNYMYDLNESNCKYIEGLHKDISELKEEIELNCLENAHLEGKIAAYEKILKIN